MSRERRIPKILKLLKNRELTSIEIGDELDIPKNNCASYLNTLKKDGRIKRTNDNIPYKYKLAKKPIELLKQLYKIMDTKMKPVKPLDDNEKEVLTEIMEMI